MGSCPSSYPAPTATATSGLPPPAGLLGRGVIRAELDQACLRACVLPGSQLGPEQTGSLELQGEQEVLGAAPGCADPEHTWGVWGGELRPSRRAGGGLRHGDIRRARRPGQGLGVTTEQSHWPP